MKLVILSDVRTAGERLAEAVGRAHPVVQIAGSAGEVGEVPPDAGFLVLHRSPIGARLFVSKLRRRFGHDHPIVVTLARSDAAELPHVLAAGADDFVEWPKEAEFVSTRLSLAAARAFDERPSGPRSIQNGQNGLLAPAGPPGPLGQGEVREASGSPDLLAGALAALPIRILVYSLDEPRLLYLNRPLRTALGLDVAQALREPLATFVSVVHPEDLPAIQARRAMWASVPDGEVREFAFRLQVEGGEWRCMATREVVFRRDARGRPQQILAVLIDDTERANAEARLEASEERLRVALSGRDDLVYEWDLASNGLTFFADTETAGRLPSTRQGWEALIHEEDLPAVRLAVERHLSEGRTFSESYRLRWRGGRLRTCLDRGRVIRDAAGRPQRWVGVCTDITDRLDEHERLSHEQKLEAVAHLAGGVAEDFNKALLAVFSNIDYALADLAPGPIRSDLVLARGAAEEAASLTRKLLAFGRRNAIEPEYISLNDVIGDAIDGLGRRLGPDVALSFESNELRGTVLADPMQIEEILITLCHRARETMPAGGSVRITTAIVRPRDDLSSLPRKMRDVRYVRLRVEDTGAGIPDELLGHIFDPFYSAADGGPRTGLDLAMVHGLVDQHEGVIVAANRKGGGAVFSIYLPLVERPPARLRRPQGEENGGHETILLVDDDELVRNLASRILRGAGYRVLTARDGLEGLRALEDHVDEVDIVILDVVMPRLGGRATWERMCTLSSRARYLFVSGYTMTASDTDFVQHGGRRFLPKPFSSGQLLREVRHVLDE